jgi:hypothetical protein
MFAAGACRAGVHGVCDSIRAAGAGVMAQLQCKWSGSRCRRSGQCAAPLAPNRAVLPVDMAVHQFGSVHKGSALGFQLLLAVATCCVHQRVVSSVHC